KVYLIDEVHMLSKPAFNALLKTLEEPPPHVKFLLATTDPQKLPVTVLSRCLKFNLKRLLPAQITGQMRHILDAEGIVFEADALAELARAADGSLRDGLSLLDQAIAYGAGSVRAADVRAMLGTIERGRVFALLDAVHVGDGAALLTEIDRLAEFSPDFAGVLDEVAAVLHRVQLKQLVSGYSAPDETDDAGIDALAAALAPEATQLYYQIAISGRRDLPLAPTPRAGFEMVLLRMLAFRPVVAGESSRQLPPPAPPATGASKTPARAPASMQDRPAAAPTRVPDPPAAVAPALIAAKPPADLSDWPALIEAAGLKGPVGQLALHASLIGIEGGVVRLALKPVHEHFSAPPLVAMMEQKLTALLGQPLKVRFEKVSREIEAPAEIAERDRSTRQRAAEESLAGDPGVQSLLREFGGRLVSDSVKADPAASANSKSAEK
ncbi:MAG TPA: DNA polymerase III subunit gamma/tau C-terminal domain-containing protein, partial [Rhodanobacteraceae bacterium]|nr:DNA polymerase III subunit gamma/tau C-terminal domain-containing protein [Rhodanobacteraceae bacterium]